MLKQVTCFSTCIGMCILVVVVIASEVVKNKIVFIGYTFCPTTYSDIILYRTFGHWSVGVT